MILFAFRGFRNKMYDHSFKSTGIIERSWSDMENKCMELRMKSKEIQPVILDF